MGKFIQCKKISTLSKVYNHIMNEGTKKNTADEGKGNTKLVCGLST